MKRRPYDVFDLRPRYCCNPLYAYSFNTQFGRNICNRALFLISHSRDPVSDRDRSCILSMEVSLNDIFLTPVFLVLTALQG